MTDEEVSALAAAQGQWLLTENVKDFQPSSSKRCKPARQPPASLVTG